VEEGRRSSEESSSAFPHPVDAPPGGKVTEKSRKSKDPAFFSSLFKHTLSMKTCAGRLRKNFAFAELLDFVKLLEMF
jgi:hypothetical protein